LQLLIVELKVHETSSIQPMLARGNALENQ